MPDVSQIYLDNNATTPIDPDVLTAMQPYLASMFGNASSVEHEHGHIAALAVERAREQIAVTIGAQPQEIIFTGSCTEANNLAILGAARANPDKRHFVTSQIEHPAVLEPMRALAREGCEVTYLAVDEFGRVSPDDLRSAIRADTLLVSVMAANNEVGTLQPIRALGAICAERGVYFHSDLAQVIAYSPIDVARDNIQLASLSGHKTYGPKGVGALYLRSRKPRVRVAPIMFGGGHERGLRSGTLNTPAIVGMGAALELAGHRAVKDGDRLRALCRQFCERLGAALPGAQLNGPPDERLPNNLSFSIDGVEPLALVRKLRTSVSFSASSACATDKVQTSYVLKAMFGDTARAARAFRVSPGRFTSEADMELAAKLMIESASQLQRIAA